jgi:hypothetical protein
MICIRVVGGRTRVSLALGLVALLAALGACNESSEPLGPTATVPQGTTTTNPYAVPAVIDEAYVNRVLAGLDQVVGDVVRLLMESRSFPPAAVNRLKEVYLDQELLQLSVDVYQDDLIRGFPDKRPSPGNRRTTVVDLISVRSDCIFAKVDVDYSAIFEVSDPSFRTQWVSLIPDTRSHSFNPTSWGLIYEGFTRNLTAPDDPCGAR